MKDLKFLESLNPGDHEFIPGAEIMWVGKGKPDHIPEGYKHVITKRWKDFVAEKESRKLKAVDGDLVCTTPKKWRKFESGVFHVGVFEGKFKPWVTTRPAFVYSNGKHPKPIPGIDIYSVGTGALFFVRDSNIPEYLVFGGRHWREVGGEIDTLPAGFLKLSDLQYPDRLIHGLDRESKEEIVEPNYVKEDGVMKTDYWRNLTACYEAGAEIKDIEKGFDLQEQKDLIVLKRKIPKASKYGEEGLFMVPLGTLDRYVSENLEKHGNRKIGERASLLLKKYFERESR
jgi:hypothetical protein